MKDLRLINDLNSPDRSDMDLRSWLCIKHPEVLSEYDNYIQENEGYFID